jgi:leucyl aminopeptidase
MGGAATALALAAMIMSAKLPVKLRILLPVAENSISANAYRPSDVLTSRNGMTVEIGNTDAEGRLVLADALSLADEDAPTDLFCFATLTGAARVALGPDLPPLFATDDTMADDVLEAGRAVHDPLWRMPFWTPYEQSLRSAVADISHISNGPFAGSVTAALFLKRFVTAATHFAHIDLYGWTPVAKPGFPKGGEPQSARAVFEMLRRRYG